MALHFIASINTHIYGVRYDQGEEVDITDWSRKQILQFLGMGLISPSQTTTEDVAGAPQVIDWLDDVDTSTTAPLAGQALIFSSGQWRPGDTIHVLDVLDDVDTTTVAPTDAQVLTYQSSSGKWKPATPSGGGGGGSAYGAVLVRAVKQAAGNLGTVSNATPVDLDATNMKVTFTVPASGSVFLRLAGVGVLISGYTPWNVVRTPANAVVFESVAGFFAGGNQSGWRDMWYLRTGLTPGASVTWKWSLRTDGGGTYYIASDASVALMEIVDSAL